MESTAQEEKRGELEGELRVEREWRQSMQGTIVSDRDKINILQQEIAQLKAMAVVIIIFIVTNGNSVFLAKSYCLFVI